MNPQSAQRDAELPQAEDLAKEHIRLEGLPAISYSVHSGDYGDSSAGLAMTSWSCSTSRSQRKSQFAGSSRVGDHDAVEGDSLGAPGSLRSRTRLRS